MGDTLVLLNARAGTLIDAGAERVRDTLLASLKGRCSRADILLLKPRDLIPQIRKAATGGFSTIVVGGGDGSVSAAVHALAGTGKTLGVLPLGTLNLLSRDLAMPQNIEEASEAIGAAHPRRIDLARINGRYFHSLSGLGFFSQMARAREEVRGYPFGRLIGVGIAAFRAFQRTYPFTLDIRTDHHREHVQALAVLVTNNRFSPSWRRTRLDEGVLEIHIAEHSDALSKLRASANLLTGAWRNDDDTDGIRTLQARHVAIGRARTRAWAATDGELARERIPLRYESVRGALDVLALP